MRMCFMVACAGGLSGVWLVEQMWTTSAGCGDERNPPAGLTDDFADDEALDAAAGQVPAAVFPGAPAAMAISRPPEVCASKPRFTTRLVHARSHLQMRRRHIRGCARPRPESRPARNASSAPANAGSASAKISAVSRLWPQHPQQMPEQAEARDVRAGRGAGFAHGFGGGPVQRGHGSRGGGQAGGVAAADLLARRPARRCPAAWSAPARRRAAVFPAPSATAGSITPVMAKPSLISSSLMLCPPISATPASASISIAPASI